MRWSPRRRIAVFRQRSRRSDRYLAGQTCQHQTLWWRNETFPVERVTQDADVETRALKFSPDGKRFAYVRGLGELWTRDVDGGDPKQVFASWDERSTTGRPMENGSSMRSTTKTSTATFGFARPTAPARRTTSRGIPTTTAIRSGRPTAR